MHWIYELPPALSEPHQKAAQNQQTSLTKPPGSLGQLEQIATRLAAIQHTHHPRANDIAIHIFAADHGVATEGVSAFPQAVTGEMIRNFSSGGAAISVLAKELHAPFQVHNLGTVNASGIENETLDQVSHYGVGLGTANLAEQSAMTAAQLEESLSIGKLVADTAVNNGCDLIIGGEMGIANTTSATALACALLNQQARALAGPGTGLTATGIDHKCAVIDRALALHNSDKPDAIALLERLGGFEIAALVGFYIRAAQLQTAILVDGFICSVAALLASRINPRCTEYFFLAHQSAEPGHSCVFEALDLQPLLQLQMRLGEGSGAAIAAPLIRSACTLHNSMATFEQADISRKDT